MVALFFNLKENLLFRYGVVALILYVIVEYCLHFKRLYELRKFAGPLAIPFFGNLYRKESLFFMRYLASLRRQHGRIFTFFALKKPYIVVCEPVVVRRVLSDTKAFFKGTDYSQQFSAVFGQGLVTSNGERHKKDRSTFGKFFIRANVANFTGIINQKTDKAIEEFMSDTIPKEGHAVNVEHFFAALALRVFMTFSLGSDFSNNLAHERYMCETVSSGSNTMGKLIIFGVPMWTCIPWVREIKECRKNILQDFVRLRDARRKLMLSDLDPPDDCLTAMLREDDMTDEEMEDHYVTLIAAGHDTTAYFASFVCYALGEHTDVQQKLVNEIENHLKDKGSVSMDDITEMKYLSQVMMETLRMYAVIPAVTREAAEEVHIKEAGITIPKGANVMIPMSLINRDPELWEFPSKFNPDRFESRGTREFTSAKDGFFPFGYGSRTCIGNTLAQVEVAVFIVKLLSKYHFSKDPNYKLQLTAGISTVTLKGVSVKLTPRKQCLY